MQVNEISFINFTNRGKNEYSRRRKRIYYFGNSFFC